MEREVNGFVDAMLNTVQTPMPMYQLMQRLRDLAGMHREKLRQYLMLYSGLEQNSMLDFYDDFEFYEREVDLLGKKTMMICWRGKYRGQSYGRAYQKGSVPKKKILLEVINGFKQVEDFHKKQLAEQILSHGEAIHPKTDQPA